MFVIYLGEEAIDVGFGIVTGVLLKPKFIHKFYIITYIIYHILDAVSIIIIVRCLIGATSAISIHLISKCSGNECDLDFAKINKKPNSVIFVTETKFTHQI